MYMDEGKPYGRGHVCVSVCVRWFGGRLCVHMTTGGEDQSSEERWEKIHLISFHPLLRQINSTNQRWLAEALFYLFYGSMIELQRQKKKSMLRPE